jgi:DeoR/GlpR family transcriptional regulator of sugar metabolism
MSTLPLSRRDRLETIRSRAVATGSVRVDALAEEFGVSVMTVHRDLDTLQSQGWLRKVRGGATAAPSALFHGDMAHRQRTMEAAKREIAEAAVDLVSPDDAVLLDDSSTVLQLVRLLPQRAPLTAITNSLAAITLLAGESGIDLIALGGAYYPAYQAFLGLGTVEAVGTLRADVFLMSTTAITGGSCFHQSQETVQVKRAMMASAARCVLLVDHTKFEKRGLHELAPLTRFDTVVVDAGTSGAELADLRDRGVHLVVAGQADD